MTTMTATPSAGRTAPRLATSNVEAAAPTSGNPAAPLPTPSAPASAEDRFLNRAVENPFTQRPVVPGTPKSDRHGRQPRQGARGSDGLTGSHALVGTRLSIQDIALGENLAKIFKFDPKLTLEGSLDGRRKAAEKAWDGLKSATDQRLPMVATSYHEPEILKSGILPMHAYSVVKVEEKDGQKLVTLRNPAPYMKDLEGNEDLRQEMKQNPQFAQLADLMTGHGLKLSDLHYGTFTIPFEQFQQSFSDVDIAQYKK
jgi:calpain family cysteine protease